MKNVILSPEKTFLRKSHEIFLALIMEQVLMKDQILETYLNIIHLGKNIYGISSGAYFYFEKMPKDLNPKESAFLAMLLPSPLKNNESFRLKELTPFGEKMVENILWKLKVDHELSQEDYEKILEQKINFRGQDAI